MRFFSYIFLLVLSACPIHAQIDTLVMMNGDKLLGEIKELQQGVMKMETDYSDKDFTIEWDKVAEIYTANTFVISLSDGRRINGTIQTDPTDSIKVLIIEPGGMQSARRMDIVFLKEIENTFWGRLDASIGLGITLTTENSLKQINSRGNIGYMGRFWRLNASLDLIRGVQRDTIRTRRTETSLVGQLLLQKSWFLALSANFLQSDEQKYRLKSTTDFSGGNLIINTNKIYLAASGGLAWTSEEFTDDTPVRNSLEGKAGFELNLFDIEDFSLLTNAFVFPSITEKERVRLDFKIDLKYDLPRDFYIKLGYTHNFDNQPAAGASKNFYKFDTTIGWEL